MKIRLSEAREHLFDRCMLKGIASEYPKSNWYKIFYTILKGRKIHSIFELKTDVTLGEK